MVQNNYKLINAIATYLIFEQIDFLNEELPDAPDYYNIDPYLLQQLPTNARQITKIENRIESVEKILKHGVVVLGDMSLNREGYNSYVTSRVHEFADNWLLNEKNKDEERKKIENKREARKPYFKDEENLNEGFAEDQWEFGTDQQEAEILENFNLESWDELVTLVKSIINYSFTRRT
jgi:hypothetical protein